MCCFPPIRLPSKHTNTNHIPIGEMENEKALVLVYAQAAHENGSFGSERSVLERSLLGVDAIPFMLFKAWVELLIDNQEMDMAKKQLQNQLAVILTSELTVDVHLCYGMLVEMYLKCLPLSKDKRAFIQACPESMLLVEHGARLLSSLDDEPEIEAPKVEAKPKKATPVKPPQGQTPGKKTELKVDEYLAPIAVGAAVTALVVWKRKAVWDFSKASLDAVAELMFA